MFGVLVYKLAGEWFMDDAAKAIILEPLIRGMPEIIQHIVGKQQDLIQVVFSSEGFTAAQNQLIPGKPVDGGYWYELKGTTMKGWLCPDLLEYFEKAPETLYVSWHK